MFPRWPFPASAQIEVGHDLSANGGKGRVKTTARRDLVCAVTYWLLGTMWNFSQ